MDAWKHKMNGSTLKWLAIITMFIDHLSCVLIFPLLGHSEIASQINRIFSPEVLAEPLLFGAFVMRYIGRLAFPIFCFLLVEGFVHTHSRPKYLRNLLVLAVLSEIPFDLAVAGAPLSWAWQNVFWTLSLGLMACWGLEALEGRREGARVMIALGKGAVLFMAMVVASLCATDYDAFGIALIVGLYWFRQNRLTQCAFGAAMGLTEITAALAFIPIYFYNGQRGRQKKWFFYVFYPAHLLLLYGIRLCILGW